eukprot:TRINITY_DN50344_c0_g1_i1.p1 TRINITY_DN50344_c0_g1~~TRINITY_DN50344_c0_g1_i1.p1  ORF type:complete len:505 (+),score=106.32 TRINITY_DN50344_c0_g1_i1:68-1516(+)
MLEARAAPAGGWPPPAARRPRYPRRAAAHRGALLAVLAPALLLGSPPASAQQVPSSSLGPGYLCCRGHTLRVGLAGEPELPWYGFDPSQTGNKRWSGYLPMLLDELANYTGFTIQIVPFDVGAPTAVVAQGIANGTIDAAPQILTEASYESAIARVVGHTTPYYHYKHKVITSYIARNPTGYGLFDPFTPELWGALIGFVPLMGLVVWLCEAWSVDPKAEDPEFDRDHRGLLGALYFTLTLVLVGGTDWGACRTAPGRIATVAIFFFFLMFTATYTANLASILTQTSATFKVSSLHDLLTVTACDPGVDTHPTTASYVAQLIEPPPVGTAMDKVTSCLEMLRAGTVSAVIAPAPLVHSGTFMCDAIATPQAVLFGPTHVAFGVTRRNIGSISFVVDRLSSAIVGLQLNDQLTKLNHQHFPAEQACTLPTGSSTTLDFQEMRGLFLIVGVILAAALLMRLVLIGVYWKNFNPPPAPKDSVQGE